jgi:hypothetical protein
VRRLTPSAAIISSFKLAEVQDIHLNDSSKTHYLNLNS